MTTVAIEKRDVSDTIDVKWDTEKRKWEARAPGKYTYHDTKEAAEEMCRHDASLVEPDAKPLPQRQAKPRRDVTQEGVNEIRQKVFANVFINRAIKRDLGQHGPMYLWFPNNHLGKYELRYGNPPSDTDRPPHLRRLKLYIPQPRVTANVADAVLALRIEKPSEDVMAMLLSIVLHQDAAVQSAFN